jgi:hypothetical protein
MDKQTALDKLSKAVNDCREAGLQLSVTPMYGEMANAVALFMPGEVGYGSGKFFISDRQTRTSSEERTSIHW